MTNLITQQDILLCPWKMLIQWLGIDGPEEFNANYFKFDEVEFSNPKEMLKEWNSGLGI